MRLALALLVVAACGRYRFDPLADGSGGDASSCGHTFCDNFDRLTALEAGWDTVSKSAGATLGYTTVAVSPPQAYQVDILLTGALEDAFLEKHLPLATTSAVVDLQLSHDSTSPAGTEIDLVQLQWEMLPVEGTTPCTAFGFYLVRDATNQFNLQETFGGCGSNQQNYLPDLVNTGPHHLHMEITFGAPAHLRLTIDGVLTTIDHDVMNHAVPPSTIKLRVGAGASRIPTAPWTFRYDDLTVDLE